MKKARNKAPQNANILQSLNAIALWAQETGYDVSTRTIYNHAERPDFPARQRGGGYLKSQVEAYAAAEWMNPGQHQAEGSGAGNDNPKYRLAKAMAEEREFKLALLKGKYYLKSEEDQRDALMLYGIKSAMLNAGPFIIQDLIAMVGGELGAEAAAKIGRMTAELRARFDNSVLDMFDNMAKAGGVDAPDCSRCREANRGPLPGAMG